MNRIVVAIGMVAAAAPAQGQSRPLTIEDYYRVQSIGSPMLSPDGKWVAFTVSRRIEVTNDDSIAVWLVPADGEALARQISPVGANATNPRWREDGRLRYSSRGREWTVRAETPDSLTAVVVTEGGRDSLRSRSDRPGDLPSPDGKWIAVIRSIAPAPAPRAELTDFEKRHEARFKGRQFDWLRFQRDGANYPVPNTADPAVSPPQEIFFSGDGTERQLTLLGLMPSGTVWRPDGSALLFTADSTYRNERSYEHNQIWSVGLDGTVRRLSADHRERKPVAATRMGGLRVEGLCSDDVPVVDLL